MMAENFEKQNFWDVLGHTKQGLMDVALEYRKKAYAPYSNFLVGAAILMDDGRVFGGCNVENASYGISICAERVAMSSAVANGKKMPLAVAVAGADGVFCSPCGACRQFLVEFNQQMEVILMQRGELVSFHLHELIPYGFRMENSS